MTDDPDKKAKKEDAKKAAKRKGSAK